MEYTAVPIEYYSISLVLIFVLALCFVVFLYHKAHGRDVEAVERGAKIVMEALRSDGRLAKNIDYENQTEPINLEDGFGKREGEEKEEMPDFFVARSQKAAEEIGQVELSEIMSEMDGKV